jgi:hypothetical protein
MGTIMKNGPFCGFRINGSDLGAIYPCPWTATESLASVYMTEIRFVRLGKIPFYLS